MPPDLENQQLNSREMLETKIINCETMKVVNEKSISDKINGNEDQSNSVSPSKRERRHKSPEVPFSLETISEPPLSPSSSTSGDATFEPTIDMMVNDFDDEQTLNEEEVLADAESQNVDDEIATLKEESEMPLEELLAKYGAMPAAPTPRKKPKRRSKKRNDDVPVLEKSDTDVKMDEEANTVTRNEDDSVTSNLIADEEENNDEDMQCTTDNLNTFVKPPDTMTSKRSHLMDLYPDQIFKDNEQETKSISLELLYEDCDDDYEEDDEEDAETESDYIRKTIMIGNAYQAYIPGGLSQYGDILPYENEDKLIWEPSQVSEREVEEYLVKAHDIKSIPRDEKTFKEQLEDERTKKENETSCVNEEKSSKETIKIVKCDEDKTSSTSLINDVGGKEPPQVVKDNEQALHLLVQCGYDFKEALRRKRLNVLPLSDRMSSWSDDECQKFEEGIQKFGKDFLQIRHSLVRTRTMRELVQFYYLWKKSERRDQTFANANTVDHMDIYLNESSDFSPNVSQNCSGNTGFGATITAAAGGRKSGVKTYSIMTGSITEHKRKQNAILNDVKHDLATLQNTNVGD